MGNTIGNENWNLRQAAILAMKTLLECPDRVKIQILINNGLS